MGGAKWNRGPPNADMIPFYETGQKNQFWSLIVSTELSDRGS